MNVKFCSKCEVEKPFENFSKRKSSKDGMVSWCKDCFKQYKKENKEKLAEKGKIYYDKNKEKRIQYQQQYRKNNPERLKETKTKEYRKNKEKYLERRKNYYKENKTEILEQMKLYQVKNKERIAIYKKNYSEKNKERLQEKSRLYLKKNPEKFRERNARRKALLRNNTVGKVDYKEILERDGMFCHLCNTEIEDGNYHMDHVVPLSKGGTHSMNNIKVAHAKCNLKKYNKSVEEAIALIQEV